MEPTEVMNITGYRFVDLPDVVELRQSFKDLCSRLHPRGHSLLATDGTDASAQALRDRLTGIIDALATTHALRTPKPAWHGTGVSTPPGR